MIGYIARLAETVRRFKSNPNGFGVAIIFTPPAGDPVTITGTHVKTKLGLDANFHAAVVKRASVTVSEADLVAAGYTVRVNGEVSMTGHTVQAPDSTGTVCSYTIRERFPDETLGILVFILDDKA